MNFLRQIPFLIRVHNQACRFLCRCRSSFALSVARLIRALDLREASPNKIGLQVLCRGETTRTERFKTGKGHAIGRSRRPRWWRTCRW